MISADERQILLHGLLASGRLSSARLLGADELSWGKPRSIVAAVEGNIEVDGRNVVLCVGICERFPLALPLIFLRSPDAFGIIPHIEHDGRICYLPHDGLLIDCSAPMNVLEEAFDAAVQTVAAGFSGVNTTDFLDELEAYWWQLAGHDPVRCYINPDNKLRRVLAGTSGRKFSDVADSIAPVQDFMGGAPWRHSPLHAAHYVPLAERVLLDRFNPRDFESLEWTRRFVARHLTAESQRELARLGAKNYKRALVILGLPRRNGGKALVGLEYQGVTGGNPLLYGKPGSRVRYVALERRDRAVIAARADGAIEMSKKRVALVGCGAVGGYLAIQLARAGVGCLTLIDPDKLTSQNAFRHVLGSSAIGMPKVDAMKRELTTKVPYVDVVLQRRRIEDLLRSHELDLGELDLVIYAAGDPTVGLYVNDYIHRASEAPALLLTWLEPYGIGGHALLTKTRKGSRGCFGCLFDSPVGGERRNRTDFAAGGQNFARSVAGCATMYTPYADLDASRTAEVASRLALDFLHDRAEGHPLLSWKGDCQAFYAAGFRTSDRYALDEGALHRLRFAYARESCTTCRYEP